MRTFIIILASIFFCFSNAFAEESINSENMRVFIYFTNCLQKL